MRFRAVGDGGIGSAGQDPISGREDGRNAGDDPCVGTHAG